MTGRWCVGVNVTSEAWSYSDPFVISFQTLELRRCKTQSPLLSSGLLGSRQGAKRPAHIWSVLESCSCSIEDEEHREVLDSLTAAGNSFFSRWFGLIIRIKMPAAHLSFFPRKDGRSRHIKTQPSVQHHVRHQIKWSTNCAASCGKGELMWKI